MPRQTYRKIDGKWQWTSEEVQAGAPSSPAVITDTLDKPIRNMATGTMHDSKSAYLKEVRASGCEVVGNDLLSRKQNKHEDKITEARVFDAMQKAEAILSDPAKRSEHNNKMQHAYENYERLIKNGAR